MSDAEHKTFSDLVKYVNAASDLAESIEADLRVSDLISTETVLKLSQFVVAANNFKEVIDRIEGLN